MTQIREAARPDLAELHAQFLAILPIIEEHAEVAHRHLVNFHDREDAIAETIALVWTWYYKFGLTRQAHDHESICVD